MDAVDMVPVVPVMFVIVTKDFLVVTAVTATAQSDPHGR